MADINIRRFFNQAQQRSNSMRPNTNPTATFLSQSLNNAKTNSTPTQPTPNLAQNTSETIQQNMRMNTLKSIDRAIYARDLMGVPKNINEFVFMIQKGMSQGQFNQMFASQLASQRNSLSQLQAQILAQLQGLDIKNMSEIVNKQMTTQLQSSIKNLEILSNGMLNLSQIAQMIQTNGKEALTKIIMSMTEASKMGVTDLSQMKDMAKLINASVAVASENEPTKTLKLLLMLYLPWLPLKEGVDFELEVTQNQESHSESDSILTVTITTVNYGIVTATLYLETSNSVQIVIQCSEDFPKQELNLRLDTDKKHYSMDTVTNFEIKKDSKQNSKSAKANINMSQTTEINPYLLLTAHSIIKHVIDIDNNASIGIDSHIDNS